MTDAQAPAGGARPGLAALGLAGGLLAAAVAAFLVYSYVCPCERAPGGFLFGERVDAPVEDWSFANDAPLCQLQIYAGIRPHSINLNCMAAPDGRLYLSCSECEGKVWSTRVDPDGPGLMRIGGRTYPVHLSRVVDEAVADRSWTARAAKLRSLRGGPDGPAETPPRPDHWWTFHVRSRS